MDFPPNWDKLESEHNRLYDPYCDVCDKCYAIDSFDYQEGTEDIPPFFVCLKCGHEVEA